MTKKKQKADPIKREFRTVGGKRRAYYVAREKGKIVSSIPIRGLAAKGVTLKDLKRRFRSKNTFDDTQLSKTVFPTGVSRIVTTRLKGAKKNSQVAVRLLVKTPRGRRAHIFTGYSNKGEVGDRGEAQAEGRALKAATSAGLKYDDIIVLKREVFYIAWRPSRRTSTGGNTNRVSSDAVQTAQTA